MIDLTGLSYDDVLLRPKKAVLETRTDADVSVPSLKLEIPLISAPMPSVATRKVLQAVAAEGGMGVVHRMNRTEDEMIEDYWAAANFLYNGVAVGLQNDADKLSRTGIRTFVLDVAHAHSVPVMRFIEQFKKAHPSAFLIAGNIATYEAAIDLINVGADAIKVGIGPGSACITRQVTGFGVPQLQAIQEARLAVDDIAPFIPVVADGGIRNSGDIMKSIAAGADAVMIGKLFANTHEAEGKHYGNASKLVNGHHAPEGIELEFESGPEPIRDVIKRLVWGIKSGISYAGGTHLHDLRDCEFIRLTDAGRRESKLA